MYDAPMQQAITAARDGAVRWWDLRSLPEDEGAGPTHFTALPMVREVTLGVPTEVRPLSLPHFPPPLLLLRSLGFGVATGPNACS